MPLHCVMACRHMGRSWLAALPKRSAPQTRGLETNGPTLQSQVYCGDRNGAHPQVRVVLNGQNPRSVAAFKTPFPHAVFVNTSLQGQLLSTARAVEGRPRGRTVEEINVHGEQVNVLGHGVLAKLVATRAGLDELLVKVYRP
jgi:hypothetical protein